MTGKRFTEAEMLDMLCRRYSRRHTGNGGGPLYIHAAQVRNTNWEARTVDYLAMATSAYEGNVLHGHEVKTSRSDWLRELKHPEKHEAFKPYMDYWWLVASDPGIVRDGELPYDWGLLTPSRNRRGLTVVIHAPRLVSEPMPKSMIACFLRRVSGDGLTDDIAARRDGQTVASA